MSTASTTSAPATCWACSIALGQSPLICPTCGKVQPSVGASYFEAFALERKLALDTQALEKEFHRLSRKLHPDRFVRAAAQEQEWSLAATALLNDAYRTLRDPIQRVEYLLRLEGLQIGKDSSPKDQGAEHRRPQPPADLLEEVFELNMQLEEMRMNQKMGEDDPALQSDLAAARAKFEALLAEVDSDLAIKATEWDSGDAAVRQTAASSMATLLDRRRYLNNLVRDVNEVLSTVTA